MDDNTALPNALPSLIDTGAVMVTIISFLPPPEMASTYTICKAMTAGDDRLHTIPQLAAKVAIESLDPATSNLGVCNPCDDLITQYANAHFCGSSRFPCDFDYFAWRDNIAQARQEGRNLAIPWDAFCCHTKIEKWNRCKSCRWGKDRFAITRTYRTMWSHIKWGANHRNNHPAL